MCDASIGALSENWSPCYACCSSHTHTQTHSHTDTHTHTYTHTHTQTHTRTHTHTYTHTQSVPSAGRVPVSTDGSGAQAAESARALTRVGAGGAAAESGLV